MTATIEVPGTELARVLDNVLLFASESAKYAPNLVHIQMAHGWAAFTTTDDYAIAHDSLGHPTSGARAVQASADDVASLVKAARSQRTKLVRLELDWTTLRLKAGDEDVTVPVESPALMWTTALSMLDPEPADEPLPPTVAFTPERLMRFGRVKAAKGAPVDIRLEPGYQAPRALLRIGPTFRGSLASIAREVAAQYLGDEASECLWPVGTPMVDLTY